MPSEAKVQTFNAKCAMSGRYLLDSNVLIDLLDGNEAVSKLSLIADSDLYASVITRIELLSAVRNTNDRVSTIHGLLSFFTIVPLNDEVENITIAIRRKTNLKLPDSIIAASAIITEAILITRDSRLAGVKWPGLKIQTLAL